MISAALTRRLYAVVSGHGMRNVAVIIHLVAAVGVASLTVEAGGSVGRALDGLAVMFCGLATCGVLVGFVLGFQRRQHAVVVDSVLVTSVFYLSTWAFTSAHSVVGDIAMLFLVGISISLAATVGWCVGELARRTADRSAL